MAERNILIKKQNRTLFVIFGILAVLLLAIFSRQGIFNDAKLTKAVEVKDGAEGNLPEPTQEAMGEPIKENTLELAKLDEQKMFQIILGDLASCLDLKTNPTQDLPAVTIETLLSQTQTDLGPVMKQSDRWMNWHLRTKEGIEKRLRLEISEAEDGQLMKTLKYFGVDKEGLPVTIEIPLEKARNPSDEDVNSMLREGEVFYKEKSAVALFSGGEHVEYLEKNGVLAELEFQRGERFFRCQGLKSRDACQCIR